MKRMGWLFCAAALFAATLGVAEEPTMPVAPMEATSPPSFAAPGDVDAETVVPPPPDPAVTAVPPPDPADTAAPPPHRW